MVSVSHGFIIQCCGLLFTFLRDMLVFHVMQPDGYLNIQLVFILFFNSGHSQRVAGPGAG